MEKVCNACRATKPATEFYRSSRDGLQGRCKACSRVPDRDRRYYQEHRENRLAQSAAWARANPAKVAGYTAKRALRDPDHRRRYYQEHREKSLAKSAAWARANPDKANARVARRRAGVGRATPHWLTAADHASIAGKYSMAALMTKLVGVPYHVDHVVPLRGKTVSGLHVPWNLQVLRGEENMKKHARFASV